MNPSIRGSVRGHREARTPRTCSSCPTTPTSSSPRSRRRSWTDERNVIVLPHQVGADGHLRGAGLRSRNASVEENTRGHEGGRRERRIPPPLPTPCAIRTTTVARFTPATSWACWTTSCTTLGHDVTEVAEQFAEEMVNEDKSPHHHLLRRGRRRGRTRTRCARPSSEEFARVRRRAPARRPAAVLLSDRGGITQTQDGSAVMPDLFYPP